MIICEKSLCTGCSVCADVCPQQCVEIKYDSNGFLHSFVEEDKCVKCKKCVSVCPANNPNNKNTVTKAYKISRIDTENAVKSTSGGVAAAFSEYIVENAGFVAGCEMDSDLIVKHSVVHNVEDLEKFKGSKYVQSKTEGIYKEVKKLLKDDKKVLFVGTPCQVSALNNFLEKSYENLYTVDLVCHGVSSQKVMENCINHIQNKIDKKIIDVKFRSKEDGYKCSKNDWNFVYENGTYVSPFNEGIVLWFASGLSLRNSCYECNFVSTSRCSDITLADYNGNDLSDDDKKFGVSLMFINTQKGMQLFDDAKRCFAFSEEDCDAVVPSCIRMCQKSKEPKSRKKFFKDLDELNFDSLIKKYTLKKILPSKLIRYYNALKRKIR